LVQLAGDGRLRVRVARTFPLAEVAAAHRYVAEGHSSGKVVLEP
jgi:NADPH:quinone reductase-like Zn-dependent oxidoreductase